MASHYQNKHKLSIILLSFLILIVFVTALPVIEIPPVRGDGENWLTGYSCRKSITVSQTTIGTDYPIRIVVWNTAGTDSGHNVYFDGAILQSTLMDVAFTTSDGETLESCWQDQHLTYSSINTTYYVRVSGNLTEASQTLYIYVGSHTASSLSNGTATFPIFYEDFNDLTIGSLNGQNGWTGSNDWDVGTSVVKEGTKTLNQAGGTPADNINHTLTTGTLVFAQTYLRTTGGSTYAKQTDFYLYQDDNQVTGMMFGNTSDIGHLVSGAWELLPITLQNNTWYSLKFVLKSNSTHEAWVNGQNYTLTSAANNFNITSSINKIMLDHYDNTYTNYWDCIIVGKYIDPEPTLAWGTIEGNPFVFEPLTLSYSTAIAGASCVFTCVWNTSNGLASANLQTNSTGQWANTTATISGNTSIATVALNSTVGTVITYSWFGVDAEGETFPLSYFYGLPASWTISDNYNLAAAGSGWEVMNPQDPFIVDMGGGTWRMYYAAWNGTAQNIGYATSTDGGVTWSKQGLVFASTGTGIESEGVSAPQIIVLPNGTWLMYYHSIQSGVDRACLATSSDGLSWTRSPANPIIDVNASTFYSERIDPETIIYNPNNAYPFTMMFGAYDGVDYQGGFAYSYDGVDWVCNPNPALVKGTAGEWDETAVYPVAMYNTGSMFNLIYQGLSSNWQLGYACSSDGQNWIKFTGNPVIGLSPWASISTENPCNPINYGNGTIFIEFCGANGGTGAIPAGPYYLGYATANDPLYGLNETTTLYYLTTTLGPTPPPTDETPVIIPTSDSETIYFRSDTYSFNETFQGYGLDLTNTDSPLTVTDTVTTNVTYAFRVWLIHTRGNLEELTSESPIAELTRTANGAGYQSAYWNCPQQDVVLGFDKLVIVIYLSDSGGDWIPRATFLSNGLLTREFYAATWNFTLYTTLAGTQSTFQYGSSTYDSRIEGVSMKEPLPQEIALYKGQSGDFFNMVVYPYTYWIGNLIYSLAFLLVGGVIYLKHKKWEIVLILVMLFFGSQGLGLLLEGVGWVVRIIYIVSLLVITIILYRLFR